MLKVIQWCTGVAGQHAARSIMAHPGMELVGCYVTSDAKNGRDVGEICGLDPIGVAATSDKEAIYAMDADCVLYMALEAFGVEKPTEEICRLLASGKNVVSTAAAEFIYPKVLGEDICGRIEAACREGGTTFHGTGIEPGWVAEVLPLVMSGMAGRIDMLLAQEVMDYTSYASPVAMFDLMGFGKEPQPVPPTELDIALVASFGGSLQMVADVLGAEIDKVVYECEVIAAEEDLEIAAGTIAKGMTAGKRYSFTAHIDGKPKLKIEHVTRAGAEAPADWPDGQGWNIVITGAPSMKMSVEIGLDGQDNNDAACLATAMHAVHAIEPVVAAQPGVSTLADLPTIVGRGTLSDKGVSGSPGF